MCAIFIKMDKKKNIKAIAEKYGIVLIYLFGSLTEKGVSHIKQTGTMPDTVSDLDVAVAFDNLPGEMIKLYGRLYREISDLFERFHIDLVFMHEVDTLFQYEIIKGERIYEKDEQYADDFEERIMKRAEDLIFKRRILDNEIMEAIEDGYFEFEYSPNS